MKTSITVTGFELSGPIPVATVFFQNFEPGKGRVVIECHGTAWSCYFGAMGPQSIETFFTLAPVDYLVGKLSRPRDLKRDLQLLEKIIRMFREKP